MTNKKDTGAKPGHDWDSTPDTVNAEGTKFWKDHASTNYAKAQGLKDAVVWLTEAFADGYRTRLLLVDGQVVADEQSVESLGVKIDLLAFQLNNPTTNPEKPPPSYAPVYAALYPELAEIAQQHGYALSIHGSLQRDFDLVAIPWVWNAKEPEILVDALTLSLIHI